MTQAKCCSNVAVLIIYLATCQKIILLMFEGFFFVITGWRRIILRNISMNVGGAGGVYLGAGQGGGG